jgi:Uma2 family endonuclease
MMAPMPNTEHQQIVSRLVSIFEELVGWPGLGSVMPGVNLSGRREDWTQDYRVPDVAVALNDSGVSDCGTHWCGGPDLVVEVVSEGDQTRAKIPWYGTLRVKELLVIDRYPWSIELLRCQQGELVQVNQSDTDNHVVLACESVPVNLRLLPGEKRPQIEVFARETDKTWIV